MPSFLFQRRVHDHVAINIQNSFAYVNLFFEKNQWSRRYPTHKYAGHLCDENLQSILNKI